MTSETASEFSIAEKLGIERLRLLLDVAAELANYAANEPVSVGDIAFDDRVAEEEMGRTRVRDALLLFQTLGLVTLDDEAKTLRLTESVIGWSHAEPQAREQHLNGWLQAAPQPVVLITSETSIVDTSDVPPQPEIESSARRTEPSRFGPGAGRRPVRVVTNAKSDEELMEELKPTVANASADTPANSAVSLRPMPRRAQPLRAEQETLAGASSRRWGGEPARSKAVENQPEKSTEPKPVSAAPSATGSTTGTVNLPTFFLLLDELNERATKLRQAGLTDDPNIKIDLWQLIEKIQTRQE